MLQIVPLRNKIIAYVTSNNMFYVPFNVDIDTSLIKKTVKSESDSIL